MSIRVVLALLLIGVAVGLGGSTTTAAGDERLFLPLVRSPLELRASYLGGVGNDLVRAMAFAPDGQLIVGGTWPNYTPPGVTPTSLLGGGTGGILWIGGGRAVSAMVRIGPSVRDLEVNAAGALVACGEFGVAVLDAATRALRWSDSRADVSRCSIGPGGGVAALAGSTVYRYGAAGGAPSSWQVAGTAVADIAIDDTRNAVFATGYTQKAPDLKVAFLRAYGPAGAALWTAYDFSAAAVAGAGLGADSEGRRVSLGRDGKLYLAASTDGGNSIFGRDPQNIGRGLGGQELVSFDSYNTPSNLSGAPSLAWYGRFRPDTGALERGQWLLSRLGDGKGNSISIRAIDAAPDGAVLLTGDTACCIQGRSTMQFAGVTLGSYESGEAFVLLVRPDFGQRQLWTVLAAPGTSAGRSSAAAAAIRADRLAVGISLTPRSAAPQRGLVTFGAIQPAPAGDSEGYFLLTPRP
jgi:hypothetical protein